MVSQPLYHNKDEEMMNPLTLSFRDNYYRGQEVFSIDFPAVTDEETLNNLLLMAS